MRTMAVAALVVSMALAAAAQQKMTFKGKMSAPQFKSKQGVIEVTVRAAVTVPKGTREAPGFTVNCLVELTAADGARYFGKAVNRASQYAEGKYDQDFFFLIKPGDAAGATVSAYHVTLDSTEGLLATEMKGCQSAEELEKRNEAAGSLEIKAQLADLKF